MSQSVIKKEEESEEFKKLFHLLSNLASNNKDPNKVISIDTDELLRSNKPLEKVVKDDTVPTRVLTIDDFLPPPVPSIRPLTTTTTTEVNELVSTPVMETPVISTTTTSPVTKTNGFAVTIGIDVTQGKTYTLSTNGNKDSSMSITIGLDVTPSSSSSIQLHHVNHPGSKILPTWNKTLEEHRADLEPKDVKEQYEEEDQERQEGEVHGETDVEADVEESGSRQELQIGEGNPLIFNYPSCKACKKSFSHFKHLKNHLKRYPVCNEWIQTMEKDHKAIPKKGIHMLVEDYLHNIITGDVPFQCKYCKNIFTNTSNHHKHFHSFMSCNRMAIADFIKHINELVK